MKSPHMRVLMLLAVVMLTFILSLRYGTETLSFSQIHHAFSPEDSKHFTLVEYRLPRALLALFIGAALALSGVLVQGIVRNPLASPDILGINHAAGVTSVAALMLFPAMSVFWLPPLAFVGGVLAFILLKHLTGNRGPLRLALLGVALTALYASVTDWLMLSHPLDINQALLWLTGSLWGRSWPFVWIALPALSLLLPLGMLFCKDLDVMALGEARASTLGVSLRWVPFLVLLLAVALAAVSVAMCGPIGFVGLVAPHLTRQLVGGRHHWLMPAAMLVGAEILLLADLLARTLRPPIEIPAGVLTAIIGAPWFFWLLMRTR
ncbi:Fe(3+) dicitrate ABC transporter permease subunit FecD [Erwinia sp.]|uniref:Fe(3+) dicitrate ABC transporter permease subunit FecD n=1 Tax=Erwinia citreus TaxID=558 RepID=UPI003C7443AE